MFLLLRSSTYRKEFCGNLSSMPFSRLSMRWIRFLEWEIWWTCYCSRVRISSQLLCIYKRKRI